MTDAERKENAESERLARKHRVAFDEMVATWDHEQAVKAIARALARGTPFGTTDTAGDVDP